MDWRATLPGAALLMVTSLFTKAKVDADVVEPTDSGCLGGDPVPAPEISRDEKSVVEGDPSTTEVSGCGEDADASVVPEVKIDLAAEEGHDDDAAPSTSGVVPSPAPAPEQHWKFNTPWKFRHLFRRLSNGGTAFLRRLSRVIAGSLVNLIKSIRSLIFIVGNINRRVSYFYDHGMYKQIHNARNAGGCTPDKRRRRPQRLRERVKKAIPLKFVLLVTLSIYTSSYSGNTWFVMSMWACILAFVADVLSAVLLINSTSLPVDWHCYLAGLSGVSMVMVPYLLLVSLDKLCAYVIIAAPLPVVAASVHSAWAGGRAAQVDDDTLDYVFDISSAVINVAAGGGLTGTIFGHNVFSQQPAGPLGFMLFFTISLAAYLILVTTVRPKELTRHAEHLSYILLLLLAATALVAAVEFVGWLACAAASIDIIEAMVSAVFALAHSSGGDTTLARDADAADLKKEQSLLSVVLTAVVFTVIMQLHSNKSTAEPGADLGPYEIVRMLLYFAAFLWSFNRMLFFHIAPASGDGGWEAAGAWAWMWSGVQFVRTIVVMLAILDSVYNLFKHAAVVSS